MYYSMTLVWSTYCKFIFKSWAPSTDLLFVLACLATMFAAFFTMAMPKIKQKLEQILFSFERSASVSNMHELEVEDNVQPVQRQSTRLTSGQIIVKKRVIPFFYALIHSTLHVAIMLVMMSMNAYVILAIIVGFTAGFVVFSDQCKVKKEKCCHAKEGKEANETNE